MNENPMPTLKERPANRSETTHGGVQFTPRVDIVETANELTLYADVPGTRPEDVDLRYENGELLLHCRVPARHRGVNPVLREYEVGDYYRVFTIHESIDSMRIAAECKDGVLTVHLPKMETVKPRQIQVRA
jgi:HSP20 family protein